MEWLVEQGLPAYNAPDLAVKSIINLRKQQQISEINNGSYDPGKIDLEKARAIIAATRKAGRDALTEDRSQNRFSSVMVCQ